MNSIIIDDENGPDHEIAGTIFAVAQWFFGTGAEEAG
jgi:hypothetical protein